MSDDKILHADALFPVRSLSNTNNFAKPNLSHLFANFIAKKNFVTKKGTTFFDSQFLFSGERKLARRLDAGLNQVILLQTEPSPIPGDVAKIRKFLDVWERHLEFVRRTQSGPAAARFRLFQVDSSCWTEPSACFQALIDDFKSECRTTVELPSPIASGRAEFLSQKWRKVVEAKNLFNFSLPPNLTSQIALEMIRLAVRWEVSVEQFQGIGGAKDLKAFRSFDHEQIQL